MHRLFLFVLLLAVAAACQSNSIDQQVGTIDVGFTNQVNGSALTLNAATYTNKSGETFTVSKFDYFISNIRLLRADGSAYVVPQDNSYFLLRAADPTSQSFTLNNIPAGDYAQIEYMIGVDSLRNTANISQRTGVLDPGSSHTSGTPPGGMYWDWNTGYIHLKLEGTSPQAPLDATGARNFRYHIGLFGGFQSPTLNNLRTVRVPLSNAPNYLSVGPKLRTTLRVIADAGKLFDGPTPIRIAQYPDVMVAPISATVASNYATMFSFGSSSAVSQ